MTPILSYKNTKKAYWVYTKISLAKTVIKTLKILKKILKKSNAYQIKRMKAWLQRFCPSSEEISNKIYYKIYIIFKKSIFIQKQKDFLKSFEKYNVCKKIKFQTKRHQKDIKECANKRHKKDTKRDKCKKAYVSKASSNSGFDFCIKFGNSNSLFALNRNFSK